MTVGTAASDELELLFVQTTMMAQFYEKFLEFLLLDGTYRTNNLKMAYGGRWKREKPTSAYCFVSSEDTDHMNTMMQTFVELQQGAQRTACVIVDKDFKEIGAIRENMPPGITIQLCEFHVKKALKRAVASSKNEDKQKLNKLLEQKVHAPNEEAYDDLKAELDRTASESFKAYFDKNWDDIKDMWVRCLCDTHFNLGNNTTNRLESQQMTPFIQP